MVLVLIGKTYHHSTNLVLSLFVVELNLKGHLFVGDANSNIYSNKNKEQAM